MIVFSRMKFGLVKDPKDDRDLILSRFLLKTPKIPEKIDWYQPSFPVRDQGETPTCVGQSVAALKSYQEFFEHKKYYDFDGFRLYNKCKKEDGLKEEGTYIRVALKIVQRDGLDYEERYYKIETYFKIDSLESLLINLGSIGPCPIGVEVFANWGNPYLNIIDTPKETWQPLGGHAILAIGYDNSRSLVRILNSWGKDWGDEGTAYITYDYLNKYLISAWAAVDLKDPFESRFFDIAKVKDWLKNVCERLLP